MQPRHSRKMIVIPFMSLSPFRCNSICGGSTGTIMRAGGVPLYAHTPLPTPRTCTHWYLLSLEGICSERGGGPGIAKLQVTFTSCSRAQHPRESCSPKPGPALIGSFSEAFRPAASHKHLSLVVWDSSSWMGSQSQNCTHRADNSIPKESPQLSEELHGGVAD